MGKKKNTNVTLIILCAVIFIALIAVIIIGNASFK